MRLLIGLCTVTAVILGSLHSADAQVDLSDLPPSYAPQIAEAQRKADQATERFAAAQSELGELEAEIDRTANRTAETEARLDEIRARLRDSAVAQYVRVGSSTPSVFDDDLNRQVRANAMAEFVTQSETDSLEDYRAAIEDLEHDQAQLDRLRSQQRDLIEELERARAQMLGELAELQRLEGERLAEIDRREQEDRQRRAEEERQRQAEAARQAEAERQRQAEAAAAARSSGGGGGGGGGGTSAPTTPIASGTWVCPVQGPHSFVDTWGAPRGGGRRHWGVDMMAAHGVPVVAPVAGTVSHRSNSIGGKSFHLNGDDGHYYFGTHLSGYANPGRVEAGTVIGYVGDTGNARGNPHLHFEIHPNGGSAVNPTPTVRAHCP